MSIWGIVRALLLVMLLIIVLPLVAILIAVTLGVILGANSGIMGAIIGVTGLLSWLTGLWLLVVFRVIPNVVLPVLRRAFARVRIFLWIYWKSLTSPAFYAEVVLKPLSYSVIFYILTIIIVFFFSFISSFYSFEKGLSDVSFVLVPVLVTSIGIAPLLAGYALPLYALLAMFLWIIAKVLSIKLSYRKCFQLTLHLGAIYGVVWLAILVVNDLESLAWIYQYLPQIMSDIFLMIIIATPFQLILGLLALLAIRKSMRAQTAVLPITGSPQSPVAQ